MDSLTVRQMTLEDVDAVQAVNVRNLTENYRRDFFRDAMMNYPMATFVAILSEMLVGYILCSSHGDEGLVVSIAIDEECRGRHLGKKLMLACRTHVNSNYVTNSFFADNALKQYYGCRTCTLHVRKNNFIAQKLYTKLGYKIVKLIPNYYSNDDGYLMRICFSDSQC